jgi:DNA (cytosine-5)-methyltransferase 1
LWGETMRFVDWFAGIGGFRLGLEQAGHQCVGFVEWDKRARQSYELIHDTSKEWTAHDVRTVEANKIPKSDIWCFGFPCTDISRNGKQRGLKGDRSGLFFSITGLIGQLKEKDRPAYLFIENVADLLSTNNGIDFLRLLIELDEIGYDAEWQVINTRQHGIGQNRNRLFIIGHLRTRCTRKVFPLQPSVKRGKLHRSPITTWAVKNATKKGYDIATDYDSVNLAFPNSATRRGRVGKGYMQTLDRSCNQAVFDPQKLRWRKVTPREAWRFQGFPDEAYDKIKDIIPEGELYGQAGNSVSVPVIYQIAKEFHIDE